MSELTLHFQGPFQWTSRNGTPSVLDSEISARSGLYLWTVATPAGELIYYVGETGRSFGVRMFEHLKEHLAGAYHVFDPIALMQAEKRELWPGLYNRDRAKLLPELLHRFEELAVPIARLVDVYRFHPAPTDSPSRLRQRIEAALSRRLFAQSGLAGEFQDKGIRYRPRRRSETPVQVRITSSKRLVALPELLEA